MLLHQGVDRHDDLACRSNACRYHGLTDFLSGRDLASAAQAIGRAGMGSIDSALNRWSSAALSVLRMVTAFLYLQHGTAKLFHVPHVAMFDQLQVLTLDGIAGLLEIVGSVLLVLGLFTRPVSFILCGEMAVAYFIAHAPQGNFFMPALNGGEEAVLYCFIFLFFALAGGGSWSFDALLALLARRVAGSRQRDGTRAS
jgi:putative oxidoreductase